MIVWGLSVVQSLLMLMALEQAFTGNCFCSRKAHACTSTEEIIFSKVSGKDFIKALHILSI